MRIEGEIVDLTDAPYASDGNLWVNGKNENGVIHLPANHSGLICLEMRLNPSFDWLKIHATKVTSSSHGELKVDTLWDAIGNTTPVG